MKFIPPIFLICLLFLFGCWHEEKKQIVHIKSNKQQLRTVKIKKSVSRLEKQFIAKQLVNIHSLDTSIKVALAYATPHNFLHKIIYENLDKCYLPCEVAIKLSNAQQALKRLYPHYNIIVFDATRPLSAQQKMWDELDLPTPIKINYLAHPTAISLHNYGAAVDVGIITDEGLLLNMGTSFDSFEELSQPRKEWQFIKDGTLSQDAYNNRVILRSVMKKSGFTGITSEWWHFNSTNKFIAAHKYQLIQ